MATRISDLQRARRFAQPSDSCPYKRRLQQSATRMCLWVSFSLQSLGLWIVVTYSSTLETKQRRISGEWYLVETFNVESLSGKDGRLKKILNQTSNSSKNSNHSSKQLVWAELSGEQVQVHVVICLNITGLIYYYYTLNDNWRANSSNKWNLRFYDLQKSI